MSDVALTCQLTGGPTDIFVTSGYLRARQLGPWLAYLECSSKLAPAEMTPASVLVRREDGTVDTFAGTVRRARVNPGSEAMKVSIVGGAGKLTTTLPALDHYQGATYVPAGVVARAICDAAGETLAPGVELALDARLLPRWHRAQDVTAATAIDLLAAELGYSWRVLPSGLVWLGPETWPAVSPSAAGAYWTGLVEDDGAATYAVRGAPFMPGQSLSGVNLIDVRYEVGGALSVVTRGAVSGDPPHVPDLALYARCYSGTVLTQNADGTLDVRCDDARIGGLRSLALRVGIPGALVTVPASSRVRVRFDGASPKGAFAEGIDQDPSASAPALRVGDVRSLVFDPGVPGVTPPALYASPDGGTSFVLVSLVAPGSTVGGTVPPPPSTPTTTLAPAGSARVRLL